MSIGGSVSEVRRVDLSCSSGVEVFLSWSILNPVKALR